MITRRQFLWVLGGGAAFSGAAVLGVRLLPDEENDGPFPLIRYGRESCFYCGMTISDARFAAAWRAPAGERHFDDIGCMVNALRRDQPGEGAAYFVHDYRDETWLDARAATYVLSPSIKTPMGYGVAAVGSTAAAEGLLPNVSAGGQGWEQLLTQIERKS